MTVRFLIAVGCLALALGCNSESHGPDAASEGAGNSVPADAVGDAGDRTGPGGSQGNSSEPGSSSGEPPGSDPPVTGDPIDLPSTVCNSRDADPVIENVDVLFIVDDSGSMTEEQAALREQLPRLVEGLALGDRDGDGMSDGPGITSLHLGVVSSDMGLVGISGIDKCSGLGDDGIMNNVPGPDVMGCQPSYPRFITHQEGVSDPETTANDLACISALGTDGCGFEQQLESGLKALWPSVDHDPSTGQVIQNRITFLGDPQGFGMLGHGDTENNGFLRNDAAQGPSLLVIVLVTDEEDCSSADTSHFTPPQFLDPNSPLVRQGLNLRCFFNPENLYAIARYVNGFKALRPGNEQLVMFMAIAGVPPDLVAPTALAQVDFADYAERDAFYDAILNDPRMQEAVDTTAAIPEAATLVPSCNTPAGKAYPPRRIVQVAREFGSNGMVQSICQDDFTPAADAILQRVGARLDDPCGP
jgi:hypothetical protein